MLACCVVVAGGRPRELEIRDAHSAQLEPAAQAIVAPSLARRTSLDAQLRPLWFVAPALAPPPPPPPARWLVVDERVPGVFLSSGVPTRSSRGPPRS
ncbi:MAG TPA: hypothetical protein VIV40_44685 [Kofleriaceae bacterium]